MKRFCVFIQFVLCIFIAQSGFSQQNPSPMQEHSRTHLRVPDRHYTGVHYVLHQPISRPVEVFIPLSSLDSTALNFVIHFHGAAYLVEHAAEQYQHPVLSASISLGSGSAVYSREFTDISTFFTLLDSLKISASRMTHHPVQIRKVILSGWSAGYGAIRAIINTPAGYERIDQILLLDGIHAGYVPDGKVLYEGGKIDSLDLDPFLQLAKDASLSGSDKTFLITHSEIFPGTFVSTTESTDFLLEHLGMSRTPVLRWGPVGMQQTSVASRGHFAVWGFAGNSAPDHVDHLNGLGYFLNELNNLSHE